MIKKLVLHRFKQFKDVEIPLRPGVSFLVGGNNSGKSSILHALAVWEFSRTILEMEKGRTAFLASEGAQGVGIGDDEFSPINIPSLRHLWTNLKVQKVNEPDGYTLKTCLHWEQGDNDFFLEFGLALANDRLFIKKTASNVKDENVHIPRLAYLPPFAGITDRETRLTPAMRNRLIGQGLSGGVVRNVIYEMQQSNQRTRRTLRADRSKLKASDLKKLRETDPWELLSSALEDLFQCGLTIRPFNEQYHTHIRIESYRGQIQDSRFKKLVGYTPRDLMVEGSGFLQWLSVYALALTPGLDVLLLDEPDAHLHCSLQLDLIERLEQLARKSEKQVILATHSTEIIKSSPVDCVIEVANGNATYLSRDTQKIGLLAGIGTHYAPRLHRLQKNRRLLLVEGDFDERVLRTWADRLGIRWPDSLVIWQWPAGHKERKQLFDQLKREIPDLMAISIRDRDDEPDGTVKQDLLDKLHANNPEGFRAMKWRRRNIENYLIHPDAIARAAKVTLTEVRQYFQEAHGLAPPDNVTHSCVVQAIRDAHGKAIMVEGGQSIRKRFGVSREGIAREMMPEEVAEDVRTLLQQVQEMCS